MAKMGRPKLEEAKDRIITMRVTPAKYETIKKYAQSALKGGIFFALFYCSAAAFSAHSW